MPVPLDRDGYRRLFDAVPTPCLLLDVDHVILDANQAYLSSLGRHLPDIVGQPVFDVFPSGPGSDSSETLAASLRAALESGRPDRLPLVKYDIEDDAGSGEYTERWWSLVNVPIRDSDHQVVAVLNAVEDLTEIVLERSRSHRDRTDIEDLRARTHGLETELLERSRALTVLSQAEVRASRRLAGLVEVGLELAAATTIDDLTSAVIDRGLSALDAHGGAVGVCDHERGVIRLTTTGSLGPRAQLVFGEVPLASPLPAAVAVRTRTPVLLGDREAGLAFSPAMADVYDTAGKVAWASLPLHVGDRVLGSISIGWEDPQVFTVDDVDLIAAFAAQCAQALDRLLTREAEQASAAATARFSEALQRSLLTDPIQPDHLQIAVRYLPAGQEAQVGGDWYDAFMTRDGSTSLVIGDVSGHDRDAAATMAQVRNLLRGIGHALVEPPAAVLSSLDLALQNLDVRGLATAVLAMIEIDGQDEDADRIIRWSNAGHPPPLLIHHDGHAELLVRPTDLLLGFDAATPRHDHEHRLPPGGTVLLYTDGLVERRGTDLDEGLERLRLAGARLGGLPLEELCDALLDELAQDAQDDVALLAVRAFPSDRPRPAEAGPEKLPDALVVDQD